MRRISTCSSPDMASDGGNDGLCPPCVPTLLETINAKHGVSGHRAIHGERTIHGLIFSAFTSTRSGAFADLRPLGKSSDDLHVMGTGERINDPHGGNLITVV